MYTYTHLWAKIWGQILANILAKHLPRIKLKSYVFHGKKDPWVAALQRHDPGVRFPLENARFERDLGHLCGPNVGQDLSPDFGPEVGVGVHFLVP